MLARELRRRWRGSVSIGGADARAVVRAGARGTRASAREDGGEAGEGRASTSYASSAAYDADDEFNERLAKGYADDDVERFARGLSRLSVAGGGGAESKRRADVRVAGVAGVRGGGARVERAEDSR